jgi:hypothetical protein
MAVAEAELRIKRVSPASLRKDIFSISRSLLQKYDGGSEEEKQQVSAPPPDRPIDHGTHPSPSKIPTVYLGRSALVHWETPSPLSAFISALPLSLPDRT